MALPSDRNTREFQAFTLASNGGVALNVVAAATGTGTATATSTTRTLDDWQFSSFVLAAGGGVALNLKST